MLSFAWLGMLGLLDLGCLGLLDLGCLSRLFGFDTLVVACCLNGQDKQDESQQQQGDLDVEKLHWLVGKEEEKGLKALCVVSAIRPDMFSLSQM